MSRAALLDLIVQFQRRQPGLIQRGRLDGYETISGFQVPLAVDEQVVAALHLQGEAAQVNDPHGEVQLDVLITPPPLVIDEALAVAAGQGFVDLSFRTPRRLLAAGCGELLLGTFAWPEVLLSLVSSRPDYLTEFGSGRSSSVLVMATIAFDH